MQLHNYQQRFVDSNAPVEVVMSPRRCGKTTAAVKAALRFGSEGVSGVYVAPNWELALKLTTAFRDLDVGKVVSHINGGNAPHSKEVIFKSGVGWIITAGHDIKISPQKYQYLDSIIIDEVCMMAIDYHVTDCGFKHQRYLSTPHSHNMWHWYHQFHDNIGGVNWNIDAAAHINNTWLDEAKRDYPPAMYYSEILGRYPKPWKNLD